MVKRKLFLFFLSLDRLNRIFFFLFSDVVQQCVRFLHRTSSVLEVIFYDCHNDQSIRSSWTFLRPNLVSNSCPRSIGSLYLQSMLNARVQRQINYQMSIGCDEKEKILITRQDRGGERMTPSTNNDRWTLNRFRSYLDNRNRTMFSLVAIWWWSNRFDYCSINVDKSQLLSCTSSQSWIKISSIFLWFFSDLSNERTNSYSKS